MTAMGKENAHYWYTENENGTELLRLGSYGVLVSMSHTELSGSCGCQ